MHNCQETQYDCNQHINSPDHCIWTKLALKLWRHKSTQIMGMYKYADSGGRSIIENK